MSGFRPCCAGVGLCRRAFPIWFVRCLDRTFCPLVKALFNIPAGPKVNPHLWSNGNDFTRSVPRHGKRVNAAFFDGHAILLRNSSIGYDLLRTDPAALWPKNNNGDTP